MAKHLKINHKKAFNEFLSTKITTLKTRKDEYSETPEDKKKFATKCPIVGSIKKQFTPLPKDDPQYSNRLSCNFCDKRISVSFTSTLKFCS